MPSNAGGDIGDTVADQPSNAGDGDAYLQTTNQTNQPAMPISTQLEVNRHRLERIFKNCRDLTYLAWKFGPNMSRHALSVYFDTIIQKTKVNYMKTVLQDLVLHEVNRLV